jgi:hypothetical protein
MAFSGKETFSHFFPTFVLSPNLAGFFSPCLLRFRQACGSVARATRDWLSLERQVPTIRLFLSATAC